MSRTAIAADAAMLRHNPGPGHPERPARYTAVMDRLRETDLLSRLTPVEVVPASNEILSAVHTEPYLMLVAREVSIGRDQLSTGDTSINGHSEEAARIAAGCVISAVDAVFQGAAGNAFCVVRPPGHHASAATGMGFCLFNNIAVGTRYAQRKWGAERVAIVDWDVHHGNGTQSVFYEDGSVLFFSTHQSPWYPGTGDQSERGAGKGEGLTINCPLPAGTGRDRIGEAFDRLLLPALDEFRPDLVMISAGFDSRAGDPLGQFRLTDDDFHEFTIRLMEVADQHCSGRLISVLEGGYSLDGLALGCEAHVRALVAG